MEEGFIDVERTLVPLLRLLVSLFEEEGPALAGVSVSARDGVRNTPEMRDVCRENWRPNICIDEDEPTCPHFVVRCYTVSNQV